MPRIQPIIWLANDLDYTKPTYEHVQRHINNCERFVRGLILSRSQGDIGLNIPEELRIDPGQVWDEQRRETWLKYLSEQLPVEVDLIMPQPTSKMWACSCKERTDEHPVDCQCPCSYCAKFMLCPCEGGNCVCPMICDCACVHCDHAGKALKRKYGLTAENSEEASWPKKARKPEKASRPNPAPEPQNCNSEGCGNEVVGNSILCQWCKDHRKCAIPFCEKLARGGKGKKAKYCYDHNGSMTDAIEVRMHADRERAASEAISVEETSHS